MRLVSPTIAEPCRDTIDGKLDPTQHLLVGAARSVLLQEPPSGSSSQRLADNPAPVGLGLVTPLRACASKCVARDVFELNFNGRQGAEKVTYGDVFLQAEQE